MKTRLFVVLFCLVWALGCGNRDPEDVETGFGSLETASVRICNNSNCVGGGNADETCVDDFDCPNGACEMLIPFNECFGGSASPRTPCETALECGSACDAGSLEGDACAVDSDCMACLGGAVLPGTQCVTAADCGGTCLGGNKLQDGEVCSDVLSCGGICVGGGADGSVCTAFTPVCEGLGGTCNVDGVQCIPSGECVQSGSCIPGECNQTREVCVGAATILEFTGMWESCVNLDQFIAGSTAPAEIMRDDGPPVQLAVSGCNSATLDISFTRNSLPDTGCASVEFTSGDKPDVQQCGETVHLEMDLR